MSGVIHWDDVEGERAELGHLAASWRALGKAAGTIKVGVNRIEIEAGKWATPVHRQTAEEEIFYVLGGSGLSWQDEETYEVAEGDCLVHLAGGETHSLRAGPNGLDVLAFGTRVRTEVGHLPRAGVGWLYRTWAEVGQGEHPWDREVAAGEPEVGAPSPRPARIVGLADTKSQEYRSVATERDLGRSAGSEQTGLRHIALVPGQAGPPAHCHSAEEEIFVVLEGGGTLELTPTPAPGQAAAVAESHALRAGHVVARPPASRVAHRLRAGGEGLTYLAYGTREPNDIAYYPNSDKIYFRGVGVMARLKRLEYMDGEAEG